MTAPDAGPTLAGELRRRRMALGWTLEQVAEQAQVSVGMLSLIETGKRRPSLKSWGRIRQTLGISGPLPEEAWRQQPREISDELVASMGACLATVRSATLAELAEATGATISEVRLALRRLADQLERAGMRVVDDGSHVLLAAESRSRRRHPPAQARAAAPADPGAGRGPGHRDRRRHGHPSPNRRGQGAAQLSIGPDGPVSLPRDSSETLALPRSRGLLCADRDDHAMGRPLVYRPTPRLLQVVEVETFEEARRKLGVPINYGYAWQPIPEAGSFGREAPASGAAE